MLMGQSLHFTTFAADEETCLIGTLTGSLHYQYKDSPLSLVPTFPSKITAVPPTQIESLGHCRYMLATHDSQLALATISVSGLHIAIVPNLPLPGVATHMRLGANDQLYLTCEPGCFAVLPLSSPSELTGKATIDSSIVQLDVVQPTGTVLVSSLTRAVLIDPSTFVTVQVGSKERRGEYGACSFKDVVLAARPNGFLWKANQTDGKVISTLKLTAEDGGKLG